MFERFIERPFKVARSVYRQLSVSNALRKRAPARTKAHHCLAMSLGTSYQIGKVGALIASAQQNDGALFAKCGKRLQRRIDVCCLGVVVAVNACDGSAGLDTVFQWSEGLQTLFDFCIVAPQRDGARSRRKRIGRIVLALDLELRSGTKGTLDALEIYREHTIVKECRGIGPACIFTHALVKTVAGAQRDVANLRCSTGCFFSSRT